MSKFLIKAPAKVNLFLHIIGVQDDNYHLLESLFVFVKIYDLLEIELDTSKKGVYFSKFTKVSKYNNTIQKAIECLMKSSQINTNVCVNVIKNILISAGLAGGSADAAAVMRLLGKLWNIDMNTLKKIALDIGTDVCACLESKTSFITGIGENVLPLPELCLPKYIILVAPKEKALSSKKVYNAYQQSNFSESIANNLPTNQEGWMDLIYKSRNDLTSTALQFIPDITEMLLALERSNGCLVSRMTGSGSTCFGLFEDANKAACAERNLQLKYPGWWIYNTEIIT
ncbi:4-(cytidine 5'-diphospho)-2-C-methyl-D-erythritol kinase [Neoehrlichia mikurensis]|uniref:4-diphosphocytidyl-2-C-methyl-D-erythritol kinase n=1 Tax=Neoehrlichia mikurensis TaxID=89586 RepID=A0A9Q9BU84_9RICK|nr:4-(cytidine 5'-diphospho)-2-C-methyl-D-erythritol kinase [Neoehrlichia mikurensis]QXK92049.1 4-(cytidine 5'-diphospho)-2-C-methyl-D-erythritol kinase [Neoehrlichia mikurensis]QXK92506.1 4-(cytidine 5'-diphospho)-2-C-methyl-D-erythritol kinase [Neoehrlichia mikurensis]QXK93742.1 4-(cytidine 5'-diphospho)-2-C-methyl-D-erythritol kinase [Neoehrlichia mikurensis]UTO55286.1 4-(cytidine 5'-diphospho)-2-C-methyl-D-erythritol kinase [Neoehrlichia mikurensis]UTO56206.1 4-(cytidine 5'-diphospho)-2-C-